MGPYDILRYYIGPPCIILGATGSVQLLAWLGTDPSSIPWHVKGNGSAWLTVAVLLLWAFLSLWVPGKVFRGPQTPFGYTPIYKANGLQFFLVSIAAYLALILVFPSLPIHLYRNFANILASCNLLAMGLCVFLLIKGKRWPDSREVVEPKPLLYEFYRGMEIHPQLLGVDVKQLTNCRFGLLAWELLVLNFFFAGWQKNGFSSAHLVSALLQTVYLAKFYWWETGYFNTLDIILDRAGYYICWGCLAFVPSLYTFASYYLVANPPVMTINGAVLTFLLGILAISLNYRVDWEKEYFKANNGRCKLWWKPATYIEAKYEASNGIRSSKLLTAGFWGIGRHLNYTFELLLALSWCLPGLGCGLLPFIYFIFLTILLVHRVFRDEEKCAAKYGSAWVTYCNQVPYRLLPGVF
ncbi:7-dehydrocholesterol reductase [Chionoecetes opilio]|uniref:7-dehydrocholesterol reductase n=1 Tax=Chionoecetes opilio TaxID=41210 RepID=A0A8J4YC08_CHIOP|nr:7-dehydrocholesterol reductase [Chionoecetes opilio]